MMKPGTKLSLSFERFLRNKQFSYNKHLWGKKGSVFKFNGGEGGDILLKRPLQDKQFGLEKWDKSEDEWDGRWFNYEIF